MSASTPNRKPGLPAAARRTPAQDGTANSSPSSSASPSTSRSSTPTLSNSSLNRTRSVRGGAPISARAAARKTPAGDDDAKAELLARMEELQEKLTQAELASAEKDKQAANVQAKLDQALKEQGMLEESMHEQTERIDELENEKKESLRARREMEQIYESERVAVLKEKEEAAEREDEMQSSLQRMKETLAQREMRAGLEDERRPSASRQTSHGKGSAPSSPSPDHAERQFAPSSLQRSDSVSRSNSKLVMQKDKIIESLRLELAEAQIKLVEMENMGGGRMQELQRQVFDTKMQNARLMEENESFQLLLSEKTLNGEFLRPGSFADSRPPSRSPYDGEAVGHSLADELGDEGEGDSEAGGDNDRERRLRAEVNSMKDQNKALTLYINNIISRLLQHEQFEQILDKTPDLMAGPGAISRKYAEVDTDKELPPSPSEGEQQPSLLQRAKSVIAPKKTRPLSQQMMPPPTTMSRADSDTAKVTEDPDTAPSVPIHRRMASGHRRSNSDWPAASVVTNMYRPAPQATSPLSPGLSSPNARTSFFQRNPSSGSVVPAVSTTNPTPTAPSSLPPPAVPAKENSAPRDSKMLSTATTSNRNSVYSNQSTYDMLEAPESVTTLNPDSPPRSTTSSGENRSGDKDNKGLSGAVMMGSKPRPLRLVQEAKDEDAAKKSTGAANRGSWFGWMNKGGAAPSGGVAPGGG